MDVKNTIPASSHIEQLTWLRGIAAFVVIISHILNSISVSYVEQDETAHYIILKALNLGSFGVILFFVLSGCTLYISNTRKTENSPVFSFYTKRFFRIWPAFVVSLICYIAFRSWFQHAYTDPHGFWIERQFLADFSLIDLINYVFLSFNLTGPAGLFNNAYWSLPVEFQFYLLFPLMIVFLNKSGSLAVVIFCGLLYFVPYLNITTTATNAVFSLAFTFGGGVLIGYMYERTSIRISPTIGLLSLIALFTLASLITNHIIELPDIPFISNHWNWYGLIGMASVFICLFSPFKLHSAIKRFLLKYGEISYSTYLYHNLLIGLAVILSVHFQIHDALLRTLLTAFLGIIGTYWVAIFSYKFVEVPSIGIGRKLSKKLAK
ncbi:acyltransferase family protein [Neptunicella marina]|uniref:Acyltransferase n=1 Tax=Neptunicella marina TaxID=2125989 RepID=A0A8J6M1V2_9ALTE|nr:acyltransferase [Neptunicella marina]MBC3765772.1 acyltransferase [Neptunicella marina]